MSYELVWFKRDLRMHDHTALTHAASKGLIRCIYIVEPDLWKLPDAALQHFQFIKESLLALHQDLQEYGGALEVHTGNAVEILNAIFQKAPFARMYSHQETGNAYTYERDRQVAAWCKEHQVNWYEYPQFGVVRALKNRDWWQSSWEKHMTQHLSNVRHLNFWRTYPIIPIQIVAPKFLQHDPPYRQHGGRPLALETLHSFLQEGSTQYRGGISSPLLAPTACSRLSPYLAYGCISMREVVQETRQQIALLPPHAKRHKAGLEAFLSRLYWHCHFIQKLESEPEIEWQNMHRGYDGLREHEFSQEYFVALKNAQTGWPMVDACVTMLRETGWLNFRMRAMLVSVAAYPLWLHWRPVGEWLATQFLDYEPGIHWSQLQMQSGTTGINTTRVYNPIKQAQDHDPKGLFVRRWLPHMRTVSEHWLLEPWKMPKNMQRSDIPQPITDLAIATKQAKQRFHERRNLAAVRSAKETIIQKHASRTTLQSSNVSSTSKGALSGSQSRKRRKDSDTTQLDLFALD